MESIQKGNNYVWEKPTKSKTGGGHSSTSVLPYFLPVTYGKTMQGTPTTYRKSWNLSVLLLYIDDTILKIPMSSIEQASGENWPHKTIGKDIMLPFLKQLLMSWRTKRQKTRNSINTQDGMPPTLAMFSTTHLILSHCHITMSRTNISDIQLGKKSTRKSTLDLTIGGRPEMLCYLMVQCRGVKMCKICDRVVSSVSERAIIILIQMLNLLK